MQYIKRCVLTTELWISPTARQNSVTDGWQAVCMRSGNNNVTEAHLMFHSCVFDMMMMMMIYLLTAIGLTTCGSSTVHIYTQTIHSTTPLTQTIHRTTQITNWEEWESCPIFASYILVFALQLRKKHGKTSVRVAEECQLARWKQNIKNRTYITIRIHKHNDKNT